MFVLFTIFLAHTFAISNFRTPPNLRVAFAGDFGLPDDNQYSDRTFRLIRQLGANFTVLLGDYTYVDLEDGYADAGISEFIQNLDDNLGKDHPVFPVAGNHDDQDWWYEESKGDEFDGFRKRFWERLKSQNLENLECFPSEGEDFGVASSCNYMGVHMILSGAGTEPPSRDDVDEIDFVDEMFSDSQSHWRVCAFHEVMRLFQVGDEDDGFSSYDMYERCRKSGAIVASAHEHSYARSKNIVKFGDVPLYLNNTGTTPDLPLLLDHDITVNFVAGTGGKDIRNCVDTFATNEWWAQAICKNTKPHPLSFGALFCDFYVNDDPGLAHCFFQEIDVNDEYDPPLQGQIRDEFYIRSMLYDGNTLDSDLSHYGDIIESIPNPWSAGAELPHNGDSDLAASSNLDNDNPGFGGSDILSTLTSQDSTASSQGKASGPLPGSENGARDILVDRSS